MSSRPPYLSCSSEKKCTSSRRSLHTAVVWRLSLLLLLQARVAIPRCSDSRWFLNRLNAGSTMCAIAKGCHRWKLFTRSNHIDYQEMRVLSYYMYGNRKCSTIVRPPVVRETGSYMWLPTAESSTCIRCEKAPLESHLVRW